MKDTFGPPPVSNKSGLYSTLDGAMVDHVNSNKKLDALNRSFRPGTFLREVEAAVVGSFGQGEAELKSQLRSRLVQFWFGTDRAVHYEVWIHERTAQIELGLHFEGSAQRNRKLYARFERELLAIQAILGTTVWLEEWDRGWSRIYETQPLWPLDTARVTDIADRMSELITVLQPVIDA